MIKILKYITNILLGILFLLFASVQFNDPDPFIWIFTYTLTALLCFGYLNAHFSSRYLWIYLFTAVTLSIGSYLQFPPQWEGFGNEMKTINNELARESMGLLICAVILFIQFGFKQLTKNRASQHTAH
ncbi:MAG: hypothetical protein RLZZ512_771 [Bacteroidota bacterium]|jgi:hypothetical protein